MLDLISLDLHHPLVESDSIIHSFLGFVVSYAPWPFSSILEFLLGFMYESEDRLGIVDDDRAVQGETKGFTFDNSVSLDYLEEHEKYDEEWVHPEYNPKVMEAAKAKLAKAKKALEEA